MRSAVVARSLAFASIAAGFAFLGWQLLATAPQSQRDRPPTPTPLVDVIDSRPADYPLVLEAEGTVASAVELEVRPQVGGRIVALHPDFEPGGLVRAGDVILQIDPEDYRLAVNAAEAEVAKARAAIALERGRRLVAREELESVGGALQIDPASRALALRAPQLRQVEAELAAAQNRLDQARLDLARTELALPFDVLVLDRARVGGEVVGARELVGRVARADEFWLELRVQPRYLDHLQVRDGGRAGSPVTLHAASGRFRGEVVRIRADLAVDSRLAGVIAAIPVEPTQRPLLGSYVRAEIQAGALPGVIRVPRRALRDNQRIWVVDRQDSLRTRSADLAWESGQQLLLHADTLQPGDRIVVSRISGLVPGTQVRSRLVDPDSGQARPEQPDVAGHDG